MSLEKDIERTLYFIAQRGWTAAGEQFFPALAQHLAVTLRADYAMVVKVIDGGQKGETLAFYAKGALASSIQYSIAGTPCENVLQKNLCFYPRNVQDLFPFDFDLRELHVESYAGIPLWDSNGAVLGLVAVMYCTPDPDEKFVKTVLQLVALRATSEMERTLYEQAILSEKQFSDSLLDSMPGTFSVIDRNGHFVRWNKNQEVVIGYSHRELSQMDAIQIFAPEHHRLARAKVAEAFRKGRCSVELNILAKDGHVLPFYFNGVRTCVGNVAYLVLTGFDISDRLRAEAALKDAKRSAETANRAKDRFLAVLSHELRTPLTPVLAAATALESQPELPAPERADFLSTIHRNIDLESKLIDDLLDVTKINYDRLDIHPEIIDLHATISAALETCQSEVETKQLNTNVELGATSSHVFGDPARLQQVFWNLIKNAVKFTPTKGQVTIRSMNNGPHLCVEVVDTGVGVEPSALPRIFKPFERGEHGNRQFGGLGLGLSIAQAVIEKHNGSLTAFSEGRDRGACFRVELRTVTPPLADANLGRQSGAGPEFHGKILLVEDNEDTRRILCQSLQRSGYLVSSADSVRDALEKSAREPFDLLISDIGLPDGSGLDLMRKLKDQYHVCGIGLSGFGAEEDIRKSIDAGFDKYMVKPVSLEALRSAISEVGFKARHNCR